jgi:hypothetical protein
MKITRENLEGLAELSEHHAEPEIAIHIHVYKGNKVLLEWYDATSDPFRIAKEIGEEKVKEFCSKLGAEYTDLDARE